MDVKLNIQELDQTQFQLKIIDEIGKICSLHKFKIWLRGSWAIDFLISRVTKVHESIGFVTFAQYRETLEQALMYSDYSKVSTNDLHTDFNKNQIGVNIIYVNQLANGNIVAEGFPDWIWEKEALQPKYYNVQGVSMYVLHPQQLLKEKVAYEKHTGRKLNEDDKDSVKVIEEFIKTMS